MKKKLDLQHTALATAIALAMGVPQVTAAEETFMEEIVVTGVRGSLKRALDLKRDSNSFVDAISSEDIGKFPDQNVAESLGRIAGIAVERTAGEGQFISVRGFDKQHTGVLVNGRLLATENDGREFSFDILASELITGAQVYKTANARIQEGGIGGVVNTLTARPFDYSGFKGAVSAKALYDDNSSSATPNISGLFSNVFLDGKLGALVSFSYLERDFLTNRTFPEGYFSGNTLNLDNGETHENVYVSNWLGMESNESTRERAGGTFALQYRPIDDLTLTLDGLYSRLDVDSELRVIGSFIGAGDIGAATVDANNTATSYSTRPGAGYLEFDSARRPRFAETQQIGFNADWAINDQLGFKFDVSYSKAEDTTAGKTNWFTAPSTASPDRVLSVDWSGNSQPRFSSTEDYSDFSNIRINNAFYEGRDNFDEVIQTNADFQYEFDNDSVLKTAYFGATYSERTKQHAVSQAPGPIQSIFAGTVIPDRFISTTNSYAGLNFPSFNGDAVAEYLLSPEVLATLSPEQAAQLAANAAANGSPLGVEPRYSESGDAQEDSWAVYFQLDLEGEIGGMSWAGDVGLRYTGSDVVSHGFAEDIIRFDLIDNDTGLTELSPVVGDITSLEETGDYDVLLPSANFALNLTEQLTLRVAAGKTVTRPTLSEVIFKVAYNLRPDDLRATVGNPALAPFEAVNYDIGLEYYFGEISYVSATFFAKDFTNEIIDSRDRIIISGQDFEREIKVNDSQETSFDGFELSLQYAFADNDLLPDALDGFGIVANYTKLSDDKADAYNVGFESTSYNYGVFYEKGPLEARIRYSYRDTYLDDETGARFNPFRPTEDGSGLGRNDPRSIADFGQMDASISYAVTDAITVSFEGINITNEEKVRYSVSENRVYDGIESGRRFNLGVRMNF